MTPGLPSAATMRGTRSRSPTDDPPRQRRRRRKLERRATRRAQLVRLVGNRGTWHGVAAHRAQRRRDREAIRVAHLPDARRRGRIDEFVARRDDREARRAKDAAPR